MRTHHALPPQPVEHLADALDVGVGRGLTAALETSASDVIDQVSAAGVRGRGGAGFPTGRKWRSLFDGRGEHDRIDVVVNAAEGEPGTFKDRSLLRSNPYLVIEGALIAAHVLSAPRIVIATKAIFERELAAVERAIGEIDAAGWLAGVEVVIARGPDHYLFGEESALLEVIEGGDPLPRQIPPYLYGLFSTAPQLGWSAGDDGDGTVPPSPGSNPSLVNNVETYAHVALVMRHGADWYRSMGTDESPGPTIVTITGDVQRPVVAEVELGHPLGSVIDELAGGVGEGRSVKAILSGVSNPVMTAEALTAPMTYEGLRAVGGGLGSAGFVVYDDRRNLVDVAYRASRFLHVESCGQCQPCKGGTANITVAVEQLTIDGAMSDRAERALERALRTVTDGSRCFLPQQERAVITSVFERFADDVAVRAGGAAGDPDVFFPKIVDLAADGAVVLDEQHTRKQPDWTYADVPVRLGPRAVRD